MNTFVRVLIKTFILCYVVTTSVSKCPQVSFDSVLVRFCDREGKCIDRVSLEECVSPEDVLDGTSYLKFYTNLTVLRRGFIHDLPELLVISAITTDITRIYPGALLNLPKLSFVHMSDCKIREIVWGVFNDHPSLYTVTLNANFISLIEREAFANMPNLRVLNLEDNRLTTYDQNWLTNSHGLEKIQLSYNRIEKIPAKAFDAFPNLTYVDLSFNVIKQLGWSIFDNVRKLDVLDFTNNKLWRIQASIFGTGTEVGEFRVSLNRLNYLGKDLLEAGKVKRLVLHPNPWQCSCLEQIKDWMRNNNATLQSIRANPRIHYQPGYPDCVFRQKQMDECWEGYDDVREMDEETYRSAVNYTNWVLDRQLRVKSECECP